MENTNVQNQVYGGINIQRVSQDATFNEKVVETPTMYIIEGNCSLNGDVELEPGSILRFEGGMINGFGKILGTRLLIESSKYQIFGINVSVSGLANGEVPVCWWGAKGDGVTDDTIAINKALDNAGTSWVVLDNMTYKINLPIVLDKNGQKLRCYGVIKYEGNGAAIDLKSQNVSLDIETLQGLGENGSGILFSGSVFHGNINVNRIEKFNYGLNLTPVNAGVQYCKISWQSICCTTGIYINLWSGENLPNSTVWVNENQFHGGRLLCQYGIVVENKQSRTIKDEEGYTSDLINGNVFNCIGFEGFGSVAIRPIILRHAWYNEFRDLRMSESLIGQNGVVNNEPWIYLEDCGYNTMNIKSIVPYSRVQAVNCNNIELRGSFTDDGYGYHKGYDKMYIVSANTAYRTPTQSNMVGFVETFKLLSSRIQSRNAIKSLYLGATSVDPIGNKEETKSFNDLFLTPYRGADIKVLSNVVEIGVYDNSTLSINIADSIVGVCPEVEMKCDIGNGSELKFVKLNDENNTNQELYSIKTSGNYRITFDEACNIIIRQMT